VWNESFGLAVLGPGQFFVEINTGVLCGQRDWNSNIIERNSRTSALFEGKGNAGGLLSLIFTPDFNARTISL